MSSLTILARKKEGFQLLLLVCQPLKTLQSRSRRKTPRQRPGVYHRLCQRRPQEDKRLRALRRELSQGPLLKALQEGFVLLLSRRWGEMPFLWEKHRIGQN